MIQKKYFKIVYGYKTHEFVSIEAGGDLERAIYAWTEKIPILLNGKMIEGRTILRIEPHIQRYTGWLESYQYGDGDDMEQIKRDVPNDLDKILLFHQSHVAKLQASGRAVEIGNGEAVKLLPNIL